MSEPAIIFDQVWKKFRLGERATSLRDLMTNVPRLLLGRSARQRVKGVFWALQDVTFKVENGECLGIMGANGAGKSTILKLLSGLMRPTAGRLAVNGSVTPLIGLGAGFSFELTGRENIYVNGSILGLSLSEIAKKEREIVEFSELETKFIDTPAKYYSSGMFLRLAFSIAIHADPAVLLIDEILAVGDASFQAKCLKKIMAFRTQKHAAVMVSHNLRHIIRTCNRAILLDKGRVLFEGAPLECTDRYMRHVHGGKTLRGGTGTDVDSDGRVISQVSLMNKEGETVQEVASGDYAIIGVDLRIPQDCEDPVVVVAVIDPLGNRIMTMSSSYSDSLPNLHELNTVYCHIPFLPLNPGRYGLQFWVMQKGKLVAHYYEHPEVVPLHVCRPSTRPDVPVDNQYGSTYAIRSWSTSCEARVEEETFLRRPNSLTG
ncbi:MAG: ABC transporter ATP-binding protein [Candidatus Hydrogenedentes bacterium]|nr:ABC transporter ATP-binding protein [Candidatus Hydrogenedentota bacterium]